MNLKDLLPTRSIIISCQADPNTPTNFVDMIVAFSTSAEMGGANGLRLEGNTNVTAVRQTTNLPIIAIHKSYTADEKVLITGDHTSIPSLIEAGANIVAFDATERERPSTLNKIITTIHQHGALALADIRTLDDVKRCMDLNVDAIATTLSVWDLPDYVPDIQLIQHIKEITDLPIIAEGNFWSPEDVKQALDAGAYSVVIGSAVTRPWRITEYYVQKTR
jgi:putative N-acetylmannosamine-6-phosphate epimerase